MAAAKPPVRKRILPRALTARPRLAVATAIGLLVGLAAARLAPGLKLTTDLILGWDALALTFNAAALHGMSRQGPAQIRARAAAEDQGRAAILALIIAAVAASIAAVAAELVLAKSTHGLAEAAHVVLAFGTVSASWLMMQVVFALHYAHQYYDADVARGGADTGGLGFPGRQAPDYWDFLHFSIVIGVASQTADVAFTSKRVRRLGTVHSLVAFAFNTVIVALTINLLAGLF